MVRIEAGEPKRLQQRLPLPQHLSFPSAKAICPPYSGAVSDSIQQPPLVLLLTRHGATFLPVRLRQRARPVQ